MILIAGCATGASSPPVAPPLPAYSETFQEKAAEEISELPLPCARQDEVMMARCSALLRMTLDYLHLRDQIRALNEADPGQDGGAG
jgi:hypothetical protein